MSFALLKDTNMEELGVVLMDMHLVTKVRVMRRVRLRDRRRPEVSIKTYTRSNTTP